MSCGPEQWREMARRDRSRGDTNHEWTIGDGEEEYGLMHECST